MKKFHDVDDCLDRVKRSQTLNTLGDVKDRLDDCQKKLKDDIKSSPITQVEWNEYKKMFEKTFDEKQEEITTRYSEKGKTYGYAPSHIKSGQKGLYKSQKRRSL